MCLALVFAIAVGSTKKIDGQGFCNLTKERLSEEDSLLICREHQPPET